MWLFVAAATDLEARAAVAALGTERALLLDAGDLSHPGWRVAGDAQDRCVASGRVIATSELACVVVRRLAIYPHELSHVHPDDRVYIAAEMTALLAGWLDGLAIPVWNRPRATVLCGPGWRREQWLAVAARLAIPVRPWRRSTREDPSAPWRPVPARFEVSVVGETAVGDAPERVREQARALAAAAGAGLMSASFDDEGLLVDVAVVPRLGSDVLAALADRIGTS